MAESKNVAPGIVVTVALPVLIQVGIYVFFLVGAGADGIGMPTLVPKATSGEVDVAAIGDFGGRSRGKLITSAAAAQVERGHLTPPRVSG